MDTKFPFVAVLAILTGIAALGLIYLTQVRDTGTEQHVDETALIEDTIILPTLEPTPPPMNIDALGDQKVSLEPTPTPPPLNESDQHIANNLTTFSTAPELISLLTKEEIVRKVVRAVHGLSEGRIVREYRPIRSPQGKFISQKLDQQTADNKQELYRISRENYARYTQYVSLFSLINNDSLIKLYQLYLPILEQAFDELGLNEGNFHSTLIKAIDVLINAPDVSESILLIRPTVRYKFENPKLEQLPSAHKLMLRMGRENSEALKIELRAFKNRLEHI